MRAACRWVLCLSVIGLLTGCGNDADDAAKERFHQQLIDKALNDDTRKAGETFLAENAKQPGVKVTASGLQYKVLKAGQGKSPQQGEVAIVNYETRRVDGELIDSTWKRGKPARLPLKHIVKGFAEGLMKMKVGGEWMLYLPADLAYGAVSPIKQIPANSALVFKVELLGVEAPKPEDLSTQNDIRSKKIGE